MKPTKQELDSLYDPADQYLRFLNDLVMMGNRSESVLFVSKMHKGLTDEEGLVLSSYYFKNMSLTECGRQLGVSKSTATTIRNRAIAKIRENLKNMWILKEL